MYRLIAAAFLIVTLCLFPLIGILALPASILLVGVGLFTIHLVSGLLEANGFRKCVPKKLRIYEERDGLEKALREGDAKAQFECGTMYFEGRGYSKDESKGVDLIQRSAAQGNADAQFFLGLLYSRGCSVLLKDDELALEWYMQAARQGKAEAQSELGTMYLNGTGTQRDDVLAYAWHNLAANDVVYSRQVRDALDSQLTFEQKSAAQQRSQQLLEEIQSRSECKCAT